MSDHVDVVVVGAGISGIGAAYHLQTLCPDRTFAILEGRGDIGGTWDLFRYPGVRSDSDMHTGANRTPRLRPSDANMPQRPWIDDFSAGYMQRVMHRFPKQGDREPWINPQNYTRDKKMFRKAPLDDGCMQFTRPRVPQGAGV